MITLRDLDIDPQEYQRMAEGIGSHEAALITLLKRVGLGKKHRQFVRDFCIVDTSIPALNTLIFHVPSGAWTPSTLNYAFIAKDIEKDVSGDAALLDTICRVNHTRRTGEVLPTRDDTPLHEQAPPYEPKISQHQADEAYRTIARHLGSPKKALLRFMGNMRIREHAFVRDFCVARIPLDGCENRCLIFYVPTGRFKTFNAPFEHALGLMQNNPSDDVNAYRSIHEEGFVPDGVDQETLLNPDDFRWDQRPPGEDFFVLSALLNGHDKNALDNKWETSIGNWAHLRERFKGRRIPPGSHLRQGDLARKYLKSLNVELPPGLI